MNNYEDQPKNGQARNNLTHGMRTLSIGSVPKGASYVGRLVMRLRRELEAAVESHKGEVCLLDAVAINTCCRWEKHAQLAQRWLNQNCADMSHDQRLAYSREVAKASTNRDRAIRQLGIDKGSGDILEALYASVSLVEPEK